MSELANASSLINHTKGGDYDTQTAQAARHRACQYLKERRKRMSPWPAIRFWLLALCLWALWARDVLQG